MYLNGIVDIVRFGDDLGMNNNMFMSLEKYRTLFKPYHTKINEYVHKHSSMKTFPPLLRFHLPGPSEIWQKQARYP